jgi:hypothetical protein
LFHNYCITEPVGLDADVDLLIKAIILTDSDPFWVFALIVTVFVVLLAPLPLNLTVNFEDSPGNKGALLQS